ncbi:unnamed protein product [Allacma fusca]|uniref:Pathogen-related protein n=1 Tax=Allacma fusca TaxID=39272 RepID=A0A8J2NYZ1_9HEXA|nr:unnamed protein product [Allacma fusca]
MDLDTLPDFMKDRNAVLKTAATWQEGPPPDYSLVDELYDREKSVHHEPGSLEDLVSNLIKNWEREVSHNKNPSEWRTMDASKFTFGSNGHWLTGQKLGEVGNYNALIGENEFYSAKRVGSSEESHKLFRGAFTQGFAWEVLEVLSPPPKVTVKWRHWGRLAGGMSCPMRNGEDREVLPSGKEIVIFGISIATLDELYRVTALETFWNPDQLMSQIAA